MDSTSFSFLLNVFNIIVTIYISVPFPEGYRKQSVYPVGTTNGTVCSPVQKCQTDFTHMFHLTGFVYFYLSITQGIYSYHPRNCLKSFLVIFLVEVAQFSVMAHKKPDVQVWRISKVNHQVIHLWMIHYGKIHVFIAEE